MVKRLLQIVLLLTLLLTALLAFGGWWLLGSAGGPRWLLAELSRRTPVAVEAEWVEGRLLDRLRLQGVRVEWPGGEAQFDVCELRWSPLRLFGGELQVDALEVTGGFLAWDTLPPAEAEAIAFFAWPRLGGWPLRLRGTLGALRLADLELRPPDGAPQRLERLTAGLGWQGGVLSLSGLAAAGAGYRLQGAGAAGFAEPQLRLDLLLGLPGEVAGFDGIGLHADLAAATDADLAGPVELRGRSGEQTQLLLAAEVAVQGEVLRLERFELTAPGRPGAVSGTGVVRLGGETPEWSLQANIRDVDLAPETGVTTDLAGTLQANGSGVAYAGAIDLENRRSGWLAARVAGPISGDGERLDLPQLTGEWLQGTLVGALHLEWAQGLALKASVQGRGLDPADITPQWPGRVNLDVAGDFSWPATGPPEGELRGRLRESMLRGRVLSGRVAAGWRGEDLRIDALELHGDGFDLSGRGRLAERLDFNAEIERLSGLLPGGEGALSAQGWLRWRDGEPAGAVNLRARELAYEGFSVGRLQLAAELPGGDGPLALAVQGQRLGLGRWQLQSAQVKLAGRPQGHTIEVQAVWSQGELQVAAQGGWREGLWRGTLQRLAGDDADAGPWRLAEPVPIEVGSDRLHLAPLLLKGANGARLRLAGDVSRRPWRGEAEAQWEELDLSRANPWLGEVNLEGRSSGGARIRWPAAGSLEVEADLAAAGRVRLGEGSVSVPTLTGNLSWGKAGLHSQLRLQIGEEGSMQGRVSSPEPPHPGLPAQLAVEARWERFDLGFIGAWLAPLELAGSSSGEGRAQLWPDGRLEMTGTAEAAGTLKEGELQVAVRRAQAEVRWDGSGLQAEVGAELAAGGRLNCRLRSSEPGSSGWPERGRIEADWAGLDLTQLHPLLPEGIHLAGAFSGQGSGEWLPGGSLSLAGKAGIDGGRIRWKGEGGEVAAELRRASLDWQWRGESLSGALELALAEKGEATGRFRLPLPARLPVRLVPDGALELELDAQMRELGLLAFFFPGQVRESRGEIAVHARVGGTWQRPQLAGSVRLTKAGAYLPAAGIELREVALEGVLEGDKLRIESFSALSGPGRLEGSGTVRLQQWLPVAYRAEFKGERFEVVHLPELHLLASPELSVEGTAERLQVRGSVRLPELLFQGREQRDVLRENPDVVMVGASEPKKSFPLALDIRVSLILGENALVKVAGVDAQLGGEIDLQVAGPEAITGRGEIHAVKGIYSVYGVQLKIVRGRLRYSGGAIDQPNLDILALRTVGEVKAGVQVSGTPRTPVVKLYSEPAMPDTDVLSYIVLGHPMGQESGQAGVLSAAAGALLARGESATLQSQIKQRLGIDVIEVESGGSEVTGSMMTIGKYLSPELYLSFGQSLFANASEARLRYSISKRWELESKAGAESSGVDLFYKIEFE